MSHRLFLPQTDDAAACSPGTQLDLDRDRSHYLLRVLRLKAGAELSCFNGTGQEWSARLTSAERRDCQITIGELIRERRPATARLTLAIGWLKGAAMDLVVQKATELGVDELVVLKTQRSNVSLDDKRTAGKLAHWRGISVSACEQSDRLFVPELAEPVTLHDYLNRQSHGQRIVLDLDSPTLDAGDTPISMTLFVGPEGGWSEAERQLFVANDVPRRGLGALTFRAETVPLVALTAVRHSWDWQSG